MPARRLHAAVLPLTLAALAPLSACWTAEGSRAGADEDVGKLLDQTGAAVLGRSAAVQLARPVDTLRARLLASASDAPTTSLSLAEALDVAAENSRDFQRQKESLYLAALNLTREQHDFALRWVGGGEAEASGTSNDTADLNLSQDLSSSINTAAGSRIVASFANSFLKNLISGGDWDGGSLLSLTFTQPLLRGAGARIVRESLTQSERDLVYAVRSFERFRANFSISIVGEYWSVVQQEADLANVEANYRSVVGAREQIEELHKAGRKTVTDLGRAQQQEYAADTQRVTAKNRLASSFDRLKLSLGLPVAAKLQLDSNELARLEQLGITPVAIDEAQAVQMALTRRYDHRTSIDEVEDSGRRILVSEDALRSALDFTAALNVPSKPGSSSRLDWSNINWSAGFDLGLALDKLVERNAYRSALISFDAAVRAREQSEDQIAADVRGSLRDIQSAIDNYRIERVAVELATQRVDATTELYAAGRVQALEMLDAQDSLLSARLNFTAAMVGYHRAKLQLMHDLEAIALDATGLRFDPALPLPQPKTTD